MSNRTAYFYTKRQRERREKKSNQQYTRRCGQKRKRSLISLFSASSISSEFVENVDVQQSDLVPIDTLTSDPLSVITNTSDDDNSNELNDDEILFKMSPYSSSLESSSASSSNLNSSDDEPDDPYAYSYLPDDRRLHPSTSATVFEFSKDILEFCRISHLPNKQRTHLLHLFRTYLPSPSLIPASDDDLFGECDIPVLLKEKCVTIISLLSENEFSNNTNTRFE